MCAWRLPPTLANRRGLFRIFALDCKTAPPLKCFYIGLLMPPASLGRGLDYLVGLNFCRHYSTAILWMHPRCYVLSLYLKVFSHGSSHQTENLRAHMAGAFLGFQFI